MCAFFRTENSLCRNVTNLGKYLGCLVLIVNSYVSSQMMSVFKNDHRKLLANNVTVILCMWLSNISAFKWQ